MRRLKNRRQQLIAHVDAASIISEQYRAIRTNIKFAKPDQAVKTILITSSIAGEGKSTTAANLAIVFAQEGKNVLLVDADMRKPTIHHMFSIFNTMGLSTILAHQHEKQDVIVQTEIEHVSVLPSGLIPPNPSELLTSMRFDALLADLKNEYDVIIFDSPPIVSLSEVQILAHKCDGTILVMKAGTTPKEMIVKARAILKASQADVLGVILNNYKMSKKQLHYYQY